MKFTWKRLIWSVVIVYLGIGIYRLMEPYHHLDEQLFTEARQEVSKFASAYGYPFENHTIETRDGYLLTTHRIPHGKQIRLPLGKPVLLMHGADGSSPQWFNSHDTSLALRLADEGYDVWIGNWRGNKYTDHKNFSKYSSEFWDFGLDELVDYDLPDIIDYMLAETKYRKIIYTGFSLGSMVGFATLSWKPEFNDKIAGFIALAPPVFQLYTPSILMAKWILKTILYLPVLTGIFGIHSILAVPDFVLNMIPLVCPHADTSLCANFFFMFGGYNPNNINLTRLPLYMTHSMYGASAKLVTLHLQLYEREHLARYDYGPEKNLQLYKNDTSPLYPLEKVSTPTLIFHAASDAIADPLDVYLLSRKIRSLVRLKLMGSHTTVHADFMWSKKLTDQYHKEIVDYLKTIQIDR